MKRPLARRPGRRIGVRLLAAATLVAPCLLAACDTNPYHGVGCVSTLPLPPAGRGGPDRGVVCLTSDNALDAPPCERIATVYIAKEHPAEDFGVIVRHKSLPGNDCKAHYDGAGRLLGTLTIGD